MKIALISCSKSKHEYPCEANEMYSKSTLFRYSYEYAKINADKIYILSAKYGLLPENQLIEPYDLTLKTMSTQQKAVWGNNVAKQIKNEFDIENDEFIILAGKEYYGFFVKQLKNYIIPLGNLLFGERISYLQNNLKSSHLIDEEMFFNKSYDTSADNGVCKQLHIIFNNSKIYDYSQINSIPFDNGIYIMFEKGETYNGLNRIVRVGTHNAQCRLKKRLKDHFLRKNKDGSIFRKNVGKAILNKRNDKYLSIWSLDTSKSENHQYLDRDIQENIENEVTNYLQGNITFAVLRVDEDKLRLRLEKVIIATLNSDEMFCPSERWLGNYSPEIEIKDSGLWLKIGLNQEIINNEELEFIKTRLNNYSNEGIVEQYKIPLNTLKTNIAINDEQSIYNKEKAKLYKNGTVGIVNIKEYIANVLETQRLIGNKECILISGNIHKQMGLSNKMPSVCSAMYKLMKSNDEILRTTNSGKSSTITIKYYL